MRRTLLSYHRTTPKKRHFISNDLSAYLWFKLIEAPSGVLAKESKIVLTTFRQRCIYVISGISMRIFLCICLSCYFSWRNSDGADVPVSEILSDTFTSLSGNSLGIFFADTRANLIGKCNTRPDTRVYAIPGAFLQSRRSSKVENILSQMEPRNVVHSDSIFSQKM